MKSFGFGLIGLIMIGVSAQASAQQTYDLSLQATAPPNNNPPTGMGSFTIDVPPPGTNLSGLFLEGPPGGGAPGNELTDMSFDFGGNIFDLSSESSPGSASVQFDSSGDLISIGYLGMDSSGDALSINGLDYTLFGTNGSPSSIGTITAAAVPEPTSMTLMTVALVGMVAVRRRRQS